MNYWVNFYDNKNHYSSIELEVSSLEELINSCMWNRNINEVVEIIPTSQEELNIPNIFS